LDVVTNYVGSVLRLAVIHCAVSAEC